MSNRQDQAFSLTVKSVGQPGRLLSASKSAYKGRAVFNANLCLQEGKFWYGDIDLDRDREALQAVADLVEGKIYVLREWDGRFENEEHPLLDRAVAVFAPSVNSTVQSKES